MQTPLIVKPRVALRANNNWTATSKIGGSVVIPQRLMQSTRLVNTHAAEVAAPTESSNGASASSAVAPAVLPGTPSKKDFPIPPDTLIKIAQKVFKTNTGVDEGSDDLLADDFNRT